MVWKDWSSTNRSPPKLRHFTESPKLAPSGAEQMAVAFAAFPVETTNEVSCIVVEVEENPRKWSLTAISQILWNWIGLAPYSAKGPHYFITNETAIKPAA